ncbi:MAG TPA: membrane protein insertase YidC [Thermoanaerobaculia bacterium]|nr:membrane protein insertase YidC [Thermoanaerobaculia bacterium]
MDYRRLLVAFLLSMAVYLGWMALFPPPPPPGTGQPDAGEAVAPAAPAEPQPPAATTGAPDAEATPPAEADAPAGAPGQAPAAPLPPVAAAREERVVVETDAFRATFTNRGAQLLSLVLKEHRGPDGKGLDLVRRRAGQPYPFALVDPSGGALPLDTALYAVERAGTAAAPEVAFRYRGPEGDAVKRFRFRGEEVFDVEATVVGTPWALLLGPGLRNPTAEEAGSQFLQAAGVYKQGDEVETVVPKGTWDPVELGGGGLRWAGLEDTYFLTVLVPEAGGLEKAVFRPVLIEPLPQGGARWVPMPPKDEITGVQKDYPRDFLLLFDPRGDTLKAAAYWGAKEHETLAALTWGLEETVRLSPFGFLARPLLLALHWIYDNVVANYGWAIVLMTIAIKLLLLPLTHKSYVSMRKMQELNPKMQAVRERYRGKLKDKQGRPNLEAQRKMNEEIMGLYRSEGVNPAGGCLPMLLQLPVFFAFYKLLFNAVELRGAPWIFWIQDLSAKDPWYVLPIVMGATQFLQVKLAPMSGDPMQRRIFQWMPVLMTALFLGFPSGLVLYWLTNNVLTIAQQAVYNRSRGTDAAGDEPEPAPRKLRRKPTP